MSNFVSKKELWLPVIVLIIVGGFIYSFNQNNPLFWDDDDWIISNNFVHAINWDNVKFWFTHDVLAGVGLESNYYRPFLLLTFALNWVVSGAKPFIYHLTSNTIHIFNSILVFWLIRRVFKRNLLAFLVSLFFLVHPLQTEAVTYISGRGDVLAAMFILLGLLFFYKSERLTTLNVQRTFNVKTSTIYYLLSTIFLALGLFSRETAITFPVLALAFYISVLSKENLLQSIKTGLIKTWPYFFVVIVYGVLRLTALNFLDTLNFYTAPNVYSENFYIRIFTFLPILWEYLKLLVVPVGLHMERGATVYTSLFQWPVWAIFLGFIGLLVWLRHLYKREKYAANQNPKSQILNSDFRIWLFGSLWFFIALGPVSGITPINALMYEHWLYLPMIGFWLILSFCLVKLFDFLRSKKLTTYYSLLTTVLVIYFSFFVYQSIQRNILWGNPEEFYKDILVYEPNNSKINNNLGALYYDNGDLDNAEIYYLKSAEAGDAFAQPYFNLGSIAQSRGDIAGAIEKFEKAIEINPNFYYPYQNLTVIYAQRGDFVQAAANVEKLKRLIPNNPRVYYNSALVYLALKDKKKALADLKEGLKYVSVDPETGRLIEELIRQLNN